MFQSKKELHGILLCLGSAIIFGLYPPAARVVYLDGGNVTFVILLTTFFRVVGLYGLALLRKKKIFQSFDESKPVLYAGFFQAVSIIGILGATYFMPGVLVVTIVFTYSGMILFYSAWRKEMLLNSANILATLVALGGLALALDIGNKSPEYSLLGVGLAFMGAVATFIRVYIFGAQSKTRHPLVIGSEAFIVAFILLLFMAFWQFPQLPVSSYGIFMSFVSAFSITLGSIGLFYGIAMIGAYKMSMITKLEPIFTMFFGILIVGEVLNMHQYIGVFLVVASLIGLQLFDKQK